MSPVAVSQSASHLGGGGSGGGGGGSGGRDGDAGGGESDGGDGDGDGGSAGAGDGDGGGLGGGGGGANGEFGGGCGGFGDGGADGPGDNGGDGGGDGGGGDTSTWHVSLTSLKRWERISWNDGTKNEWSSAGCVAIAVSVAWSIEPKPQVKRMTPWALRRSAAAIAVVSSPSTVWTPSPRSRAIGSASGRV